MRLIYEDDDILVVSKPRLMHSVRHEPSDPPTASDWLVQHCPSCREASPDSRDGGLVQRLDYYTSGLLIGARSQAAWKALRQLLADGGVEKEYYALVEGNVGRDEQTIALDINQKTRNKRVLVRGIDKTGLCSTFVRGEAALCGVPDEVSLVRARANRLRRHQIRVHLAEMGAPLVGDQLYGSSKSLEQYCEFLAGIVGTYEGFFLHASRLTFRQPLSAKELALTDMRVVDQLSSRFAERLTAHS